LRLLTAFTLCAFTIATSAQTITVGKDNKTVAVTVTDEVYVPADVATVTVGFTGYGSDQNQTYADATKVSNAIVDALYASGIKQDAIESAGQSLTEIDSDDKVRYGKGLRYRFSQSWHVTVPAVSAAEAIHTAVTAGANDSGGIEWKLSNEEAAEAAAADKALAHAQKIAEQYASRLKNKLGSLVYVSNQMPQRGLFGAMLNTESASVSARKMNLKPLAIVPEKISKSATVYAVFAIE
jgi:uncharacterized protein YggE